MLAVTISGWWSCRLNFLFCAFLHLYYSITVILYTLYERQTCNMYINLYKTAKEEAHFCSDSQER